MNELAIAIVARMTADIAAGGLNASDGATGGFHRGKAPEGSSYPRIHFKPITGLPQYVMTNEAFRKYFIQFTTFAKDPINSTDSGVAIASRLSKRIQTLFTDAAFSISGHELIYCRPERELPSATEQDQANGDDIYSEGIVIEIWTAEG
jgi:hypothetical protein